MRGPPPRAPRRRRARLMRARVRTANLRTRILDFGGFDSSIILSLRGGTPKPTGNSPERLSQEILERRFLVGGLGVSMSAPVSVSALPRMSWTY